MACLSKHFLKRLPAIFGVIVVSLIAGLVFLRPTYADIPIPDKSPILIVGGNIKETNVGAEAHLDRKTLESIGIKKMTSTNPFEQGKHDYEGILLADLLSFVGASGTQLLATALDGYSIEIPVEDATKFPVMLAMIKNGKQMGIRDKGPIWVIYPIDQFSELKDEKYSSRSIWQLNRIDVQ